MSLDDEIAHLRDLDLHGLRARWKSMFRQQPPSHLPCPWRIRNYAAIGIWNRPRQWYRQA
jgi:hypothetical protein